MKLATFLVAASVVGTVATTISSRTLSERNSVTPQDIRSCAKFARQFLPGPTTVERAIEAAVDHCALDKREDDRNWVCLHFKEGLKNAFHRQNPQKELTANGFCSVAEAYMIELRGATRVANVGSGPLMNFHLSPACEQKVTAAFEKHTKTVKAAEVPELWYMMCLNQECAHLLPSRTRWCSVAHRPTHTSGVCDAARKFVQDGVNAIGSDTEMSASDVCGLYAEFVTEMGHDVDSYEHVVHAEFNKRVPIPADPARALHSSQVVNDAGSHFIRDNAGAVAYNGVRSGSSRHAVAIVPQILATAVVAWVAALQ